MWQREFHAACIAHATHVVTAQVRALVTELVGSLADCTGEPLADDNVHALLLGLARVHHAAAAEAVRSPPPPHLSP